MEPKKNKVLLLGWDAADWKFIDKMIAEGLMPTLEKFLKEGVRGNLATLDPPLSPMLWTSIATGKRAYDHGVLGFIEPDPNGEDLRSINSTTRKVKAIWNILNQEGKSSNITAWWPSFPVEKINGNMVCNFIQLAKKQYGDPWEIGERMVHPESLADEIAGLRVHPFEISKPICKLFINDFESIDLPNDPNFARFINIFAQTLTVHAIGTYLLRTKEVDFNAIYFDGLDHFGHGFMQYHPPKMEKVTDIDFARYNQVMRGAYRFFDMTLERYLQLAGEETTVMIVSDHGFHSDHLRPKFIPHDPAGPAVEHRSLGIFAIKGPGIKKGETIYGASLLDITPTLLTIFDLPVAKDMEGTPLVQIFENKPEVKYIDSWENVPGDDARHSENSRLDPWAEKKAMDQLIELGYVDAPGEDKKKNRDVISDESDFYLAKAYINGRKVDKALPILRELYHKRPAAARFGVSFMHALLDQRCFTEAKDVIDAYRKRQEIAPFYLDFLDGKLHQMIYKPRRAYQLFNAALEKSGDWADLYFEIGKCLLALNNWKDAEAPLRKAIEIDGENALYYHSLGICYFRQGKYEEALDVLFDAIERTFYLPGAHYHIGECFYFLKRYNEALNAYLQAVQLFPGMTKAHHRIIDIYQKTNQPEKAKPHQQLMDKIKKTVYIVSGLPRSGTSMMMQMLHNGGLPVLTDEKRSADNNNPKGYYEFEPVKALMRDKSWLPQAEGKVVKVIAQLLNQLPPDFTYKVIFMLRPMNEVIKSQQVMLKMDTNVYPTAIAQAFEKSLLLVKEWERNNSNVRIQYVNYHDVIDNTEEEAQTINAFLGNKLDITKMMESVHPELYRNKS